MRSNTLSEITTPNQQPRAIRGVALQTRCPRLYLALQLGPGRTATGERSAVAVSLDGPKGRTARDETFFAAEEGLILSLSLRLARAQSMNRSPNPRIYSKRRAVFL